LERFVLVLVEAVDAEAARLRGGGPARAERVISSRVDSGTTVEVIVRHLSGSVDDPAAALTPAEVSAIAALQSDFEATPPSLCSVGPSEIAVLADVPAGPGGGEFFAAAAAGDGDLLQRTREVQERISVRLASFNRLNLDRNVWLNGPGSFLGVVGARLAVKAGTSLSLTGFGKDRIGLDELRRAANVTYDLGFGNCREKGLTAAYAATHFSEFKQVAAASVDSTTFHGTHAIAIACTQDSAVFDLSTYDDLLGDVAPDALFAADCYVIDPWPWLGVTERLTRDYVTQQGWTDVPELMMVDVATSPPGPSTGGPDVCVIDGDTSPGQCTPFEIPPELLPEPMPIPGGDLLGACTSPGSFVCNMFYGAEVTEPSLRDACTQSGATWIDGACPASGSHGACTLFAGDPYLQRTFVFYDDPSLTPEEQAEEAADHQADCLAQPAEGGGPGVWTSPYVPPGG
jgi:hypothetical protein